MTNSGTGTALRGRSSVSGAYLDFETARSTTLGVASSDFYGVGGVADIEIHHNLVRDAYYEIVPYLGLQGTVLYHEEYDESGAGVLNMSVDNKTTTQLSSALGFQLRSSYEIKEFIVYPTFKLAWEHQYLDDAIKQTSRFSSASSAVVNSEGPKQNRNSALVGLDLAVSNLAETTSLYTAYEGDFSSDSQGHSFSAGLKWRW